MKDYTDRSDRQAWPRFLATGLAFTLVLGLLVWLGAAPAEAQRTLSVQPAASSVDTGATFTVEVCLDDAAGMAGFQFDLPYDSALVSYVGGSSPPAGDLLAGLGWSIASNLLKDPNGVPIAVRVLGYHFPTVALSGGSGCLVELEFQAGNSTGATALRLENYTLSDYWGVALTPVVGVGGCKRVGGCDDGNQCTADSLDPATCGCVHTPKANGTACNDGYPCTSDDVCTNGTCAGTPKTCPGDQCNTGVCDPVTGQCSTVPKANGTACDDGSACTSDDVCTNGTCAGTPKTCPGDQCNTGVCDPVTGQCSTVPKGNGTACNDGSACTSNDVCTNGTCGGTQKNCDDRKACTVDTCDPATGNCLHTPVNCDDGNACTADSCNTKTGQCVNTPINCDDGNPCTIDTCDPATGNCLHTPVNCDDGNACTADSCNTKTVQCVNTLKNCDDGDPCTIDTCDPETGQCLHTPSGLVEVGIAKFTVPNRVKVGQTATLTVTISNTGCVGTTVQCTVAKGTQVIGTQGVLVPKGGTVNVNFSYTYVAADVPSVCFTATISAPGDVNPNNNQATACSKVAR